MRRLWSRRKPAPTSEPPPEGGQHPKKKKPRRRGRIKIFLLRLFVYGTLGFAAVLMISYATLSYLLKSKDLLAMLIDNVELQTGGRLTVDSLDFRLLHGLSIKGLSFYPPALDDTRGHRGGGVTQEKPILRLAELKVGYNIPKLLAGRIHIESLKLRKPEVYLRQDDGKFNFDGILAFRAKNFPPDPNATPEPDPAPEVPAGETADMPPAFLLSPTLAYMPLEILTRDIGIEDLHLDMDSFVSGKQTQALALEGFSTDLGAHWFKNQSSFWFSILCPPDQMLKLSIKEPSKDAKAQDQATLLPTLEVETALSMRAEVRDFSKIAYDLALRVAKVKTPIAAYDDVSIIAKVRMEADDNYKTVLIPEIELDLAEAVLYGLSGKISINNYQAEQISLKLTNSFALDFDQAIKLAKPFAPEIKAGGQINADELQIEGTLEPKKLQAINPEKGIAIPDVWGVVWLEDVWADIPGTGLSMQPIAGDLSISLGNAMNSDATQADIDVDILIPEVMASSTVPKVGKVEAGVKDMSIKLTTRALWPTMIAPILKLDIEAAHVLSRGENISPLDVPLLVDVDADGRADLQRLSATANIELTDLFEFSSMVDCQAQCERFRSGVSLRLDSLKKLHTMVLPLGGTLGLGDFMPTAMGGSIDLQFQAKGRLPNPMATPPPELVKKADVRFNLATSIDKLAVQVPFFKVDLKGFGTRVLASGSTTEQHFELAQKFDRVTAELAMLKTPEGKPSHVDVQRFNFETVVDNEVSAAPNIEDVKGLLGMLSTTLATKLSVGRFAGLPGLLPKPISDIQLGVEVAQQRVEDIQLRGFTFRLPDYGLAVDTKAEARIGPDYMPQRAKLDFRTDLNLSGGEPIPLGIKTSGAISVRLAVDSADMKVVKVDGGTSFERFSLTLPDFKDAAKPPVLVVEEIKGTLPFKQIIDIPALQAQFSKKKNLAATDTAATNNANDEGPSANDQAFENVTKKYFDKTEDKLLKNANLVSIVDYGSVRPFYPERRPLSIKRIEAANLELSKLEFDLELRQNWFALNQFVISFLGGKIHGDLQLAFDPLPKLFKTSMHLTKLDTRKMIERFPNLKGKASSWNVISGDPEIDGTVRFSYDLISNDMNGGVEITKIGKEQLRMMLYYVDPYEQNQTITDIRGYLGLGEVKGVSIPLRNGQIGMKVEIVSLGLVPIPGIPRLENFPISQIVDNIKAQVMAAADAQQNAAPEGENEQQDNKPPDASKNNTPEVTPQTPPQATKAS